MSTDEIRSILSSINIDQSSVLIEKVDDSLRVHVPISRAANASVIMAKMVQLIENAGGKVVEFSYRAADCSLGLIIKTY